jgi:PAS domain S-box-containing protein
MVSANKVAETTFGYSKDELIGKPVIMLMPESYRRLHQKAVKRLAEGGQPRIMGRLLEMTGARKDGSQFPLELSLANWDMSDERFFTGIIRDITHRKQVEKLKDSFIGMVSHELRTPLTVMIGALSTAMMPGMAEPEKQQMMRDSLSEAELLRGLLDNLLELSRYQAERLELAKMPISIAYVIQYTAERFRNVSNLHNLVIRVPKGLPPVEVDQARVEHVLGNLIDNAIKYSPKGGEVAIAARTVDGSMEISVSDRGIGIPEKDIKNLFKRFERLKGTELNTARGMGLGLFLCRLLVEAHGGRIWAESEPGKGSTFFFTLPLNSKKRLSSSGGAPADS